MSFRMSHDEGATTVDLLHCNGIHFAITTVLGTTTTNQQNVENSHDHSSVINYPFKRPDAADKGKHCVHESDQHIRGTDTLFRALNTIGTLL